MGVSGRYQFDLKFGVKWEDLYDSTVFSLIISNLLVIIWAAIAKWSLSFILWVYWTQSVLIGLFWFLKILAFKNLYRKSTTSSDNIVRMGVIERIAGGLFFLIHYGGFHLVYIAFLRFQFGTCPVKPLVIFGGIFFINQLFSFFANIEKEKGQRANFREFMSFPYARIVPMHLTIILGAGLRESGLGDEFVLLLFLVLKTAADVIMHIKQKKGFTGRLLDIKPKVNLESQLLQLPDGQVISVAENPGLAKKLKSIEDFPEEIRKEVYEKIIPKEQILIQKVSSEESPPESKCRCNEINYLEGEQAHRYAKEHLKAVRSDGGWETEYVCPDTGKHWLEDFTKIADSDIEKYSRLRAVPQKED